MIKLNHITKYYKTGAGLTYVLRDINLVVEEGEFVTIMGLT
jgi:ABC-type lipoprotein export system ATPase subunit